MSGLKTIERTYPNGAKYFELHIHNQAIGTADVVDGGYLARGRRKPVATLEAAAKQCLDAAISEQENQANKLRGMLATLLKHKSIASPVAKPSGGGRS